MDSILTLLNIARRKAKIDESSDWCNGAETYLVEIRKELVEVEQELDSGRLCNLEYELGDVLWDYLNLLVALEKEQGINTESVFLRASKKYEQRVSGIENGLSWQEIKARQKQELLHS